jgi:hypothetical protein
MAQELGMSYVIPAEASDDPWHPVITSMEVDEF